MDVATSRKPKAPTHQRQHGPSAEMKRQLYHTMLRIRLVEERICELYPEQEIRCPCHLYIGQEAVAVGTCANLSEEDVLFGTYRGHGIYLAKGGALKQLLAELYGKQTGCTHGRGGSMQLVAPEVGLLCTSAIVGGTIPMAVGGALSAKLRGTNQVSVVIFGDGATEEGVFHESMNFAAVKQVPTVFVCENNFYSCYTPQHVRQPLDNIFERAHAYGMPGVRVDGNDVLAVYRAVGEAVTHARAGQGPCLIECRTYRWREHVGPNEDTHVGYRSPEEVREWKARCPIRCFGQQLETEQILSAEVMAQWDKEIRLEIDTAVAYAKASPFPDVRELSRGVYAESGS